MKNLIILAIFGLFLASCGDGSRHHMSLNDKNGFDTTYNVEQKELKISGWDKPYMLFFFSTMCGACESQVPIINELIKEYGENIKVYGVMGDTKGFDSDIFVLKEKNINFPTTSVPKSVSYLSSVVGGVMGTPVTYVFDKNGRITKQFLGLYPKSAFEGEIKRLLD
ncbi:protein disulfide reductase, TlpA family [Campylobacter iguaniorum]|uniref:TlpA family protein disulfide reductase n=1 Tax=Campylobacter iguaniorum TaxID=1244531 RepID=UPI0007C9348D|nr:TlpA disulfide reductase family protein [Campylobacter iguaniorum]ANE35677.1 protein disulfide reductase, TlpA family [Campylobacter iguaniorum]